MKAEDFIKKEEFNVHPVNGYTIPYSRLVRMLEEYAVVIAEKQRHACQVEMNKRSHFVGNECYLHAEDIIKEPLVI